jgi:hypothetical protein
LPLHFRQAPMNRKQHVATIVPVGARRAAIFHPRRHCFPAPSTRSLSIGTSRNKSCATRTSRIRCGRPIRSGVKLPHLLALGWICENHPPRSPEKDSHFDEAVELVRRLTRTGEHISKDHLRGAFGISVGRVRPHRPTRKAGMISTKDAAHRGFAPARLLRKPFRVVGG